MLPGCSQARRGKREDFEKVEGNWDLPDDAVVALQLLRAQYPKCPAAGSFPVALVSQIYSLVNDRTAVDRELDQAFCRQELRLFRSFICMPTSHCVQLAFTSTVARANNESTSFRIVCLDGCPLTVVLNQIAGSRDRQFGHEHGRLHCSCAKGCRCLCL
jgi:hypothetical protein